MFIDSPGHQAKFSNLNFFLWFLLAFQSGIINIGGFLSLHRFVTHTTGFATHFAADLLIEDYALAGKMLIVPLFFLLGAMISGMLVDRRHLLKQEPNYSFIFFFISLLIILIIIGDLAGNYQPFGIEQHPTTEFLIMATLSLTSGLQNAVVTTASGTVVRTTHLTGITTDLGIGLIRAFTKAPGRVSEQHEHRANQLRGGTILSFIMGSVVGGLLFQQFNFLGFFLPATISLALGLYSRHLTVTKRKRENQ